VGLIESIPPIQNKLGSSPYRVGDFLAIRSLATYKLEP